MFPALMIGGVVLFLVICLLARDWYLKRRAAQSSERHQAIARHIESAWQSAIASRREKTGHGDGMGRTPTPMP